MSEGMPTYLDAVLDDGGLDVGGCGGRAPGLGGVHGVGEAVEVRVQELNVGQGVGHCACQGVVREHQVAGR